MADDFIYKGSNYSRIYKLKDDSGDYVTLTGWTIRTELSNNTEKLDIITASILDDNIIMTITGQATDELEPYVEYKLKIRLANADESTVIRKTITLKVKVDI